MTHWFRWSVDLKLMFDYRCSINLRWFCLLTDSKNSVPSASGEPDFPASTGWVLFPIFPFFVNHNFHYRSESGQMTNMEYLYGVWGMEYEVKGIESHQISTKIVLYWPSTTQAQPKTSFIGANTSNKCFSNGLEIPVLAKFQYFGRCCDWKLHLPCRQNMLPK